MKPITPRRKTPSSRRPAKAGHHKALPQRNHDDVRSARVHKEAQTLLASIGKPEPKPFKADPFQLESLQKLRRQDVVVSAATGSGKTWIALEATREFLADHCGIWYATPLKALSNAKYQEFGDALGPENVGILTGDRKENPDAPIIVGTTEILRNQLYDAMQAGVDLQVDLVILDEAHYLSDPDRGVVWEEVLIYLPSRVKLLLLSATISNAWEVAHWLSHIRQTSCTVVESSERPVPLHPLFLTPSGDLTPFFKGKRLFSSAAACAKIQSQKGRKRFPQAKPPDFNDTIAALREADLLPAIVFLKSRSDCDKALQSLVPSPRSPEEAGFEDTVEQYLELYPELKHQRQLHRLLRCRAGSHHAGQLPAWRLLVETLMAQGHLEAIFSTSTVAAGVNFPARTVVLLQSDRFDGRSFVDMTATDLHQMTGRAGRRGMDNAGFVVVVPGRFMDVALVKELFLSSPEPLRSRIAVNFSMTLNLLLSHDPEGIRKLLALSFAAFHENPRRSQKAHQKLVKEFRAHLNLLEELSYVAEDGTPTYDGKWAAQLRLDHPLLIAELIRGGELTGLTPQELAAVMAPFVVDKDKEIGVSKELWNRTRPLWKRFRRMVRTLKPLAQILIDRGFEVPSIMFWPAAAVFLWAEEVEWTDLVLHVDADEGDLAMMILRTADHLRQLLSLSDEQPRLAETARQAVAMLMRAPLV